MFENIILHEHDVMKKLTDLISSRLLASSLGTTSSSRHTVPLLLSWREECQEVRKRAKGRGRAVESYWE